MCCLKYLVLGLTLAGTACIAETTDRLSRAPTSDTSFARRVRTLIDESTSDVTLTGLIAPSFLALPLPGLAILDYQGKRVVVVDTLGRIVASLGRPGGGPGELLFPMALVRVDSGIGVLDGGKQAVVYLGPKTAMGDLRLDSILAHERSLVTGINRLANGDWVYTAYHVDAGKRSERLVRVSSGVATLLAETPPAATRAVEYPCNVVLASEPPVLWPTLRWAAAGSTIVFSEDAPYRVGRWRSGAVDHLENPQVPLRRLTTAEAVQLPIGGRVMTERGSACTLSAESAAAQRGLAPFIPALSALRLTPDGSIWVQRFAGPGNVAPTDVFAGDGRLVRTLTDVPFPATFIDETTFVAIERQESGTSVLALWRTSSVRNER